MTTATYALLGFGLAIVMNRCGVLRTENAIHVIIGLYGGVIAVACVERKWPLVLYYLSAISISVAVLWMAAVKES